MDKPVPRRYESGAAPEELAPGVVWAQPKGKPRQGFGTVYVMPPRPAGEVLWTAQWVDELAEPDEHGELAGIEIFEGSRPEVLSWARSRPAQQRLMPVESDPNWVPLPDDDADVVA